jgi:hypothetical protein
MKKSASKIHPVEQAAEWLFKFFLALLVMAGLVPAIAYLVKAVAVAVRGGLQ